MLRDLQEAACRLHGEGEAGPMGVHGAGGTKRRDRALHQQPAGRCQDAVAKTGSVKLCATTPPTFDSWPREEGRGKEGEACPIDLVVIKGMPLFTLAQQISIVLSP